MSLLNAFVSLEWKFLMTMCCLSWIIALWEHKSLILPLNPHLEIYACCIWPNLKVYTQKTMRHKNILIKFRLQIQIFYTGLSLKNYPKVSSMPAEFRQGVWGSFAWRFSSACLISKMIFTSQQLLAPSGADSDDTSSLF